VGGFASGSTQLTEKMASQFFFPTQKPATTAPVTTAPVTTAPVTVVQVPVTTAPVVATKNITSTTLTAANPSASAPIYGPTPTTAPAPAIPLTVTAPTQNVFSTGSIFTQMPSSGSATATAPVKVVEVPATTAPVTAAPADAPKTVTSTQNVFSTGSIFTQAASSASAVGVANTSTSTPSTTSTSTPSTTSTSTPSTTSTLVDTAVKIGTEIVSNVATGVYSKIIDASATGGGEPAPAYNPPGSFADSIAKANADSTPPPPSKTPYIIGGIALLAVGAYLLSQRRR
jgi:MYXO-CTERM domain-containing protein